LNKDLIRLLKYRRDSMVNETLRTKQYLLTVAASKSLIARAFAELPEVSEVLKNGTIVIIAGTTNGYVAREVLKKAGLDADFCTKGYYRGITTPPGFKVEKIDFPGDVIIRKGELVKGKTIYDVVDELDAGDIIVKGANAVNLETRQAGIYIGDRKSGTIGASLPVIVGRRVKLYIPVGLEKRVPGNIYDIVKKINSPNTSGPRMMPVDGEIITELEAINILTGAKAELVAAGGICGAEGSCYLAVTGNDEQLRKVDEIISAVSREPAFSM